MIYKTSRHLGHTCEPGSIIPLRLLIEYLMRHRMLIQFRSFLITFIEPGLRGNWDDGNRVVS